jgi:hypothetical protein
MVFVGTLSGCVVSCDNQMGFDSEKPYLAVILIYGVRIYPSVSVGDNENENEVLYLECSVQFHIHSPFSPLVGICNHCLCVMVIGLLKC